jgi:hypothetical protein
VWTSTSLGPTYSHWGLVTLETCSNLDPFAFGARSPMTPVHILGPVHICDLFTYRARSHSRSLHIWGLFLTLLRTYTAYVAPGAMRASERCQPGLPLTRSCPSRLQFWPRAAVRASFRRGARAHWPNARSTGTPGKINSLPFQASRDSGSRLDSAFSEVDHQAIGRQCLPACKDRTSGLRLSKWIIRQLIASVHWRAKTGQVKGPDSISHVIVEIRIVLPSLRLSESNELISVCTLQSRQHSTAFAACGDLSDNAP